VHNIPKELQATLSEGMLGIGTQRLLTSNKQAYERLLKEFGNNPNVLMQFSLEATFNPNFAKQVAKISEKLPSTTNFKQVVIYLHNNRGTVIKSLDETLSLIDRAVLASEELTVRILESPKLQQVLRDLDNPEDIKTIWSNFWKEKPKSSFSEFAEAEVRVMNTKTMDEFGKAKVEVTKYADDIIKSGLGRSQRPYTITTVVDQKTGKVYTGFNTGIESFEDVHPLLKNKLPEVSLEDWKTFNCSECHAFDQALRDGAKWEDLLDYHTVQYNSQLKKYVDVERCNNCKFTFDGTTPTSE
jgi:hypothetical protein